jgi:hypothetical protein
MYLYLTLIFLTQPFALLELLARIRSTSCGTVRSSCPHPPLPRTWPGRPPGGSLAHSVGRGDPAVTLRPDNAPGAILAAFLGSSRPGHHRAGGGGPTMRAVPTVSWTGAGPSRTKGVTILRTPRDGHRPERPEVHWAGEANSRRPYIFSFVAGPCQSTGGSIWKTGQDRRGPARPSC